MLKSNHINPFLLFDEWYKEENALAVSIPSACCLSTIGLDGYPNARFVSLKEIKNGCFIITGPLNSRKGAELLQAPKTALTFWWPFTEKQVRIQGNAEQISDVDAETYFNERPFDARVVSLISKQGEKLRGLNLELEFKEKIDQLNGQAIGKPDGWGGFSIEPMRIELMEFQASRLHIRTLFKKESGSWTMDMLQP